MHTRVVCLLGLFGLGLFLLAACGGGEEAVAIPTSPPATATRPPATDTPQLTPTPETTPTLQPVPTATPAPTPTPTPGPDLVALGREIYLQTPPNVGPQALWCFQCHFIEGLTAGLIGPDHTHVATAAAIRVPGLSGAEYLRESIVEPEKRVAEGVERATPGLMTTAITEGLTDEQVDALVAFLLTLK